MLAGLWRFGMSRLLVFAVLASVLFAACGDEESAAPTAATATVTAASASASPASSSSAQGAAAGAAAAAALHGKFCGDWKQSSAKTPPVGGTGAAPVSPGADMKTSVETTAAFMKTLADQAPSEVRADFQVLSKFWGDYAALMARNNYDFMRLAMDPDLEKVMTGSEDLDKATGNIEAWVKKNCA